MNKPIAIGIFGDLGLFFLRMVKAQNLAEISRFKLANPWIYDVNLGSISIRTEIAFNNPIKDSLKWLNQLSHFGQMESSNKSLELAKADGDDAYIRMNEKLQLEIKASMVNIPGKKKK